jgi:hypothetical protein
MRDFSNFPTRLLTLDKQERWHDYSDVFLLSMTNVILRQCTALMLRLWMIDKNGEIAYREWTMKRY